jgi:hypothetical protein
MDISSFFLINGQEIIAKVVDEQPDHFVVEQPLNVHMMQGPQGPQLGFAPMSMIRKDVHVAIYKHSLVSPPVEVEKQVADSYIQNTTGIAIAGAGQILHG